MSNTNAPVRLVYTATDNGTVEHAPVQSPWHDELQEYLHSKSVAKLAGMTRATASSYCG